MKTNGTHKPFLGQPDNGFFLFISGRVAMMCLRRLVRN